MKRVILSLFLIISSTILSQSSWKKIDSKNNFRKQQLIPRKHFPREFNLYNLSIKSFKDKLNTAGKNSSKELFLPDKNGELNRFSVEETPTLAYGLAEKFPSIKTYTAQGIDDPTAIAKITVGTDGVHVIIFSANSSTLYIDPYNYQRTNYIAYEKKSLSQSSSKFGCSLYKNKYENERKKKYHKRNANDGKLRTFRLAIACTAEYSQFHLKDQGISENASEQVKKAAVISAVNTTIARVNSVYERELAVRMTLVNNNDKIIYFDPEKDKLTNDSDSKLIEESQKVCDSIIGDTNYDIGHTFSTAGGGLAGIGVICLTGEKARGITGNSQPKNDPYDIDYVAHEIGHQFGAPHTFNNSCSGNRSSYSAVEPGSGSTIMGYAGICSPNVQNNSNDYFHAVSIDNIWNTIQNTSCATETATNNSAPTANAGADVFVPKSTPLILKGIASDTDGSNLTHNWEQIDNEIATMPPLSTNSAGPMFRSLPPNTSPDRYLPKLATVISGKTSSKWEVIPSVAREMNFAYTVRDNKPNGGASARDDKKITITNAAPFIVTSQKKQETWVSGTTQTITWDKSTTNVAPINCKNVRIKLSTDGGATFPITLIESTPNDGEHRIKAPKYTTNSARIMVEAIDNIFYNVNTTNFSIKEIKNPSFNITNNIKEISTCSNNNSLEFDVIIDFINNFNEPVNLSVSGLPNGTTSSFSQSIISESKTVKMTLTNFNNAATQDYTIIIKGTSTSLSKTANISLSLYNNNFAKLTLTEPLTGAKNTKSQPTLKWNKEINATSYKISIASDESFNNIIETGTSNTNSYLVSKDLEFKTKYYWRVQAKNNCGESQFSSSNHFYTVNCNYCPSIGNKAYNTSITGVTFDTLKNTSTKNTGYEDYTNMKAHVIRGNNYQLSVNINTDGGYTLTTKAWIDWNQNCKFEANEEYVLGETTNVSDKPTSKSPLSITVPKDAEIGNALMRVSTKFSDAKKITYATSCEKNFDGEVEDYTIVVDDSFATDKNLFTDINLYPTVSNGKINLSFKAKDKTTIIRLFDLKGRLVNKQEFSTQSSRFSKEINFGNLSSELYILQIENAGQTIIRKIIIH